MCLPLLYKMGMTYSQYGSTIFVKWVILALWHGLIVYFACYMVLESIYTHKSDGQDIGFWFGGHVVYGACVILANW